MDGAVTLTAHIRNHQASPRGRRRSLLPRRRRHQRHSHRRRGRQTGTSQSPPPFNLRGTPTLNRACTPTRNPQFDSFLFYSTDWVHALTPATPQLNTVEFVCFVQPSSKWFRVCTTNSTLTKHSSSLHFGGICFQTCRIHPWGLISLDWSVARSVWMKNGRNKTNCASFAVVVVFAVGVTLLDLRLARARHTRMQQW
jgi:hypothetical protein